MGAGQSIDSSIQELKSEAKKLDTDEQEKALKEVTELEDRIKALIKDYKDKKSSENKPAPVVGDAKVETPATGAAAATTAEQAGGKRLKKRRISNKKRVSHRLTRSLKLI